MPMEEPAFPEPGLTNREPGTRLLWVEGGLNHAET